MKLLLLASKYFAIQEKADKVSKDHLAQALKVVSVKDVAARSGINNFFKWDKDFRSVEFTTFNLEQKTEAEKHTTIPFTEEMSSFVKEMKKIGFSTASETSTNQAIPKPKGFVEKLKEISAFEEKLSALLLGQDQAIEAVSDHLKKASSNPKKGQPQGVFLFMGPPGTGKTYLSELMVEHLDAYDNVEVFDMANYQSENDNYDFVGITNSYSNATPGRLTTSVAAHPRSIVVFDEFEKANSRVQDSLLSLFSKGSVQDQFKIQSEEDRKNAGIYKQYFNEKGVLEVDFSQAIIVITSNLGQSLYSKPEFLDSLKNDPISAKSAVIDAMSKETKITRGSEEPAITPPMLSRMSAASIVVFNKLDSENLFRLANQQIESRIKEEEENIEASINFNDQDSIMKMFLLSIGPNFDIRKLKSAIPDDLPFDIITDELQIHYKKASAKPIKSVKLEITNQAKKQLKEILDSSGESCITKQMFRKHQTVNYTTTSVIKKDTLTFTFDNIEIVKVNKVDDFDAKIGFSLELPTTTFEDIAGHTKVKERLSETVGFLKNPSIITKHDVDLPKGILLYGTPGTGKTMLAKALANEAELPFIATTGNDLLSAGVDGIKELFARARDYAPCIIFIDEIDAIQKRGTNSYMDTIINRLLTEIDGFDSKADEPVFIVGATNRIDRLDSALIRSGRIEYHIEVPYLDKEARGYFIDKILAHSAFSNITVARDDLIQLTTGMSGSELERIKRECIFEISKLDKLDVENDMLTEQINLIKYGHKLDLSKEKLRLETTAVHEAGHLVAQWYLSPETKIEQITIVARSNSLGFVSFDHGDNPEVNLKWYMNQSCCALAGREAQIMKFGESSLDAGASSDLRAVMRYANNAIVNLGMDASLYNISTKSFKEIDGSSLFTSEIEKAVRAWVDTATKQTRELLIKHWKEVEAISDAAMEKETLYENEIAEILGERK